jgi:hypothetical protein
MSLHQRCGLELGYWKTRRGARSGPHGIAFCLDSHRLNPRLLNPLADSAWKCHNAVRNDAEIQNRRVSE